MAHDAKSSSLVLQQGGMSLQPHLVVLSLANLWNFAVVRPGKLLHAYGNLYRAVFIKTEMVKIGIERTLSLNALSCFLSINHEESEKTLILLGEMHLSVSRY